jgi:hypothetical protein
MISMEPSLDARSQMDHRYIDQFAVAERYLNHSLTAQERTAFESHMVDCQECTDRVLLAEMFQIREVNGLPSEGLPSAGLPARPSTGLVLRLKPWQIGALAITAALVLAAFALVIRVFLR